MEWGNLLSTARFSDDSDASDALRPAYALDFDRITFSEPFRRLANKIQVHPLYNNDHLHHRLIHSIETVSVGRSLGLSIGDQLEKNRKIEKGDKYILSGIVQAACLAHDIGNPPFGHSGEAAIGQWFKRKFDANPSGIIRNLNEAHRQEFIDFEGNAQGFRILTNLEIYKGNGGMDLSYAVLGAFTKYPVTAFVQTLIKKENATDPLYCGLKKFGLFESEFQNFEQVAKKLGLPEETCKQKTWWRRHPLVFLVEAADDICYNILDIEDACLSGDISYRKASGVLAPLDPTRTYSGEESIAKMRAIGINVAIKSCVDAFMKNYDDIMNGCFSSSLIEASEKKNEFEIIKKLAKERIFTAKRKTELEVYGRNVIHNVLDGVFPIFDELSAHKWKVNKLSNYNQQLVRALDLDLGGVNSNYSALHSLTDFVSGMTDRYSVKTAKMLSGI